MLMMRIGLRTSPESLSPVGELDGPAEDAGETRGGLAGDAAESLAAAGAATPESDLLSVSDA
jgi:hypothetical protein